MSYIYTNYRPAYPNELYHHGIKNQQWGVTNGPPYPLDSAEHRKVVRGEMKAAKKQAKADYKSSKRNVENSAMMLRGAEKENAKWQKKADKIHAKEEKALNQMKSLRDHYQKMYDKTGNEKYRHSANVYDSAMKLRVNNLTNNPNKKYDKIIAKNADAKANLDYWKGQYSKNLGEYRQNAANVGKNAKYGDDKFSVIRASTKAGGATANNMLLGPLLGAIKTSSDLNRWSKENYAKNGYNPKRMQDAKDASYKQNNKPAAQPTKSAEPRHSGNAKQNMTTSAGVKTVSPQTAFNSAVKAVAKEYGQKMGISPKDLSKSMTFAARYDNGNREVVIITDKGTFTTLVDPTGRALRTSMDD